MIDLGSSGLRALLRCHPPGFRRRFGAEMEAVIEAMTEDEGGARRCLPAAADLGISAVGEWRAVLVAAWRGVPYEPAADRGPTWPRLRCASPQRTTRLQDPPFSPLPSLRRRHGGELPPRAPTMR